MRLIIQPSYEFVSKWTANYVATKIKEFNPNSKKHFVLGLPTGSSPLGMYRELIKLYKRGYVSFKYIKTFSMDEYVGIPEDHLESYHSFMWNNFFSHTDIDKTNVNILNGNAKDLEKECSDYEKKIKDAGGIKLFIGGIGPDGHVAFNEPGSSLGSLTSVKTLNKDTISANSRFFDNDIKKVPKTALTVGVKTGLDAEEVLIIISEHSKAHVLAKVVEDSVNHMWRVSALQFHPKDMIVCDELSTYELKVGTVKYFKEIEAKHLEPRTQLLRKKSKSF